MSSPRAPHAWRLAAALGATLLAATAGLVLLRPGAPSPAAGATVPPERGCDVPPLAPVRALPGAEGPPVLLWAAGGVRLLLDGAPVFSAPEAPRHFPVGDHTVQLEADGQQPLRVQVRFEPWTPALLHAQVDPGVGLTLVRLHAPCTRCPAPTRPVERLGHVPSAQGTSTLLAEAAAALRRGAWPEALTALEGVPPAARSAPLFLRLASAVHADGWAPAAARRALAALPPSAAADLAPLLQRLDALATAEQARRAHTQLTRWNRTTERFGALVARFEPLAPQATGAASRRLEALTRGFEAAHASQDTLSAEEALRAAEESLTTLVAQLRSARPHDCAYQAEVVATAAR